MKSIAAAGALAALCLAACSDDDTSDRVPSGSAVVAPGGVEPKPNADPGEPVARDLPAVDPSAEPVDPDELIKVRPD